MDVLQTARNMANKVVGKFFKDMDADPEADKDAVAREKDKSRRYYEMLAKTFLESRVTYNLGLQGEIDYRERAIQSMADKVYEYVKGNYFPNLTMSTNDTNETKTFYAIFSRGFLEGINTPVDTAADMADKVCLHMKARYSPNEEFDDGVIRANSLTTAEGFIEGMETE